MKKTKKTILIVLMTILAGIVLSYGKIKQYMDDRAFYTKTHGWDYLRMPLIPPFELNDITFNENMEFAGKWTLDGPHDNDDVFNLLMDYQVSNVTKVDIIDDYIFFYCDEEDVKIGDEVIKFESKYVVLNTLNYEASKFSSETDFTEYVKGLGINKVDWKDTAECYKQFRETKILPWFPKE